MHVRSRFTLVMMAILLMVGMVGIQPSKSVEANNSLQNYLSHRIGLILI